MLSRLYFDESLKRNADEYLEVAFSQIFHDKEDRAALPTLLDLYAAQPFGDAAISFTDALNTVETARKWVGQFGELQVWLHDNSWFAKVGPDSPSQLPVSHPKQLHAILLAGIQVCENIPTKF